MSHDVRNIEFAAQILGSEEGKMHYSVGVAAPSGYCFAGTCLLGQKSTHQFCTPYAAGSCKCHATSISGSTHGKAPQPAPSLHMMQTLEDLQVSCITVMGNALDYWHVSVAGHG